MNEWIGQVLPFWKDLTETQKQMLRMHTAEEKYEKGVLLHIDGGECAGVQIVKEGQVRVYITSPGGGEITLYRLVEGDVSILSASCMMKGMDISLDMMMESDAVLCTIPKDVYKKLNGANAAVKDYTMEMVSERFSDVMWLFNQYVFSNAASRLAGAILEHMALAGTEKFAITHDVLARDMGTAREVVTRLLKQFQTEGYVRLSRGYIEVLNARALEKI